MFNCVFNYRKKRIITLKYIFFVFYIIQYCIRKSIKYISHKRLRNLQVVLLGHFSYIIFFIHSIFRYVKIKYKYLFFGTIYIDPYLHIIGLKNPVNER